MMSEARVDKPIGTSLDIIVHPLWHHTLTDPPVSGTVASVEWTHLPREVLLLIASNLGAKDLCNLEATNKELRQLARDEAVWEALCRRTFNVPRRSHPPPTWRGLYIFNHQALVHLFSGQQQQQQTPSWTPLLQAGGGAPILIHAGLG